MMEYLPEYERNNYERTPGGILFNTYVTYLRRVKSRLC